LGIGVQQSVVLLLSKEARSRENFVFLLAPGFWILAPSFWLLTSDPYRIRLKNLLQRIL